MDMISLENDIPVALAQSAHRGTSFSPEQRGAQERAGYAATLASDYEALAKYAQTDDKRATLDVEFSRYRAGYRARYLALLSAKSRCMSTMITGGSNFPTARNRKRSDAADKRASEIQAYRERALAAIRKVLRPELRPIMAGDNDATTRLAEAITKAEKIQVTMKAVNAAIRKHARSGAAQVEALVTLGLTEPQAIEILKPDFCGRVGFADYQLKNNNADIRRMKARLEKIGRDQSTASTEVEGEHARLHDAPADNRVRLVFAGKPSDEVRDRLKRAGFRWTPSLGCWQAYRNHHTLTVAAREAGGSGIKATATADSCDETDVLGEDVG